MPAVRVTDLPCTSALSGEIPIILRDLECPESRRNRSDAGVPVHSRELYSTELQPKALSTVTLIFQVKTWFGRITQPVTVFGGQLSDAVSPGNLSAGRETSTFKR